jgi:hypothetical protein
LSEYLVSAVRKSQLVIPIPCTVRDGAFGAVFPDQSRILSLRNTITGNVSDLEIENTHVVSGENLYDTIDSQPGSSILRVGCDLLSGTSHCP